MRLGSTPVLDFGSFSVKAGFAGESYPLLVFTQEQFHPKSWPIVRGKIEDWQLFEQVRTSRFFRYSNLSLEDVLCRI